jgi:hypothetical protein
MRFGLRCWGHLWGHTRFWEARICICSNRMDWVLNAVPRHHYPFRHVPPHSIKFNKINRIGKN